MYLPKLSGAGRQKMRVAIDRISSKLRPFEAEMPPELSPTAFLIYPYICNCPDGARNLLPKVIC